MCYGTCNKCQKHFEDYVDFVEHSCVVEARKKVGA
jgi:hypothetical protein